MVEQNIVSKRAVIVGKVQGVWYRDSTAKMAKKLGITGWVRNCQDGSVEAVFQGNSTAVEQMISWCSQGPPAAKVDRVDVTDELTDENICHDFQVRY